MQVAATVASSSLLEAAAAAQKAQHQLAGLEFSMAAFAEAQQEVSRYNRSVSCRSCLDIAVVPLYISIQVSVVSMLRLE